MNPRLTIALSLLAAPLVGLAFSMLLGIGVVREGAPGVVSLGAGALVFLPALGLGALTGKRSIGIPVGLFVWSSALIVGFPLYFPGERDRALAAGFGTMGGMFERTPDPAVAVRLDAVLPGVPAGRVPSAAAVAEPEPETPAAGDGGAREAIAEITKPSRLSSDEVVLPYEGSGNSLSVPVELVGPQGRSLEVSMLFDTGASFTSVDQRTLGRLGITVPEDAPEVTVRTAAGERQTRLVMLDRVWIGGFEVEGVTVGVCDACAHEEDVGLLGLNVSGRFLVTVDQQRQELILKPRQDTQDRVADIKYWVEVRAQATKWPDGRLEVEVELDNNAPRVVRGAEVSIRCDRSWSATLPPVDPGDTGRAQVSLPLGADCEGYQVKLEKARW